MLSWIMDKTSTVWFWVVLMPFHRLFRCPFGRHEDLLMYITDGRTSVMPCAFCDKEREPTAEEIANHPHRDWSPERQAAFNARIERDLQRLKDAGYE